MKVVFGTGVEAPITEVSSIYSLGIPTVDPDAVEEFKALLTPENLEHFQLVNDANEVVGEAENFIFHGVSDTGAMGEERTETNFIVREMTDVEKEMVALRRENEIYAEAIADLASIVAEG